SVVYSFAAVAAVFVDILRISACAVRPISLSNVRNQPLFDEPRNVVTVLFQHHHVAVSMNAGALQADKLDFDTGLLQIARSAVIKYGMIRGLRRDHRDWNAYQVH